MTKTQFLKRLNRLLKSVTNSDKPFGGKQVILVGDFHQLPPVKPFERCLECGDPMTRAGISLEYSYICQKRNVLVKEKCRKTVQSRLSSKLAAQLCPWTKSES
jgi:hypothetical protein